MRRWWLGAVVLPLVLGCESNGSGPNPSRPVPAGLVIRQNGAIIVTVDGNGVQGGLVVQAGRSGAPIQVTFREADGTEIAPAADESMAVAILDPNRALFTPDTPGAFVGRFGGLSAGTTPVTFSFVRDAGGSVFVSPGVTLTVTP